MNNNTIVMRLLEKEVARSRGLFQYDYGQRLMFTGVELPDAYEVHFSNNKTGVSKTVIGDATGVDIPDEYLLNGEPVYVWVFLHAGETDGETEYHGVIDVIKRAKPVHDKPTPVQQDEITQAIAVLNAAVTTTGQDVVDATEAKNAAEAAQVAAEEAQGIAEDARDEAVQAKNAAVSAAEAAEAAKDAAVEAKETSEEIAEALPGTIEAALQEAKDSGEFDGATFVPSIDDGVISWTNDRQLPNPEPVDIAEELELDTYAKKDEIPTKVSELTNDSGYLTTETDPTVPNWAKQQNKPTYTAREVGAIASTLKGSASGVAELDSSGKVPTAQLPYNIASTTETQEIIDEWEVSGS